ncbi:Hypothetical protein PHPALM_10622 [Phytophthora palmivora]|uniref:Uncharacterized protein n=1 Tax=Phytophthora palmivora TaxID=4796 RepID=A0A2P4Y4K4_9STRA|nr:Hypothetical protein PHPALM_10622 [Phytophthora palmivora]
MEASTGSTGSTGSTVRVFDGTTDFRVWRARVENELMRYHLLGYVMVRSYDGSQSFTYNGEEVPSRTPVIHVDDEQQLGMKEEASCGRNSATQQTQQGRLSRWDVLGESAEAKSILQRFLHPDVECAILNKNIYDSWRMLCALYGNRSTPGAHDVYEMHRVLHHIRLGDKKEEPVREFITRWEMLMQQYALATGIDLTDGFRSVSLVQTLPSAWRSMVASWRGFRPFVPYAELVEKVIATREQMQAQTEAASIPNTEVSKSKSDVQVAHLPETSSNTSEKTEGNPTTKPAQEHTTKPTSKPVENQGQNQVENNMEKSAEQRAPEAPKTTEKMVPPPLDVTTGANDTVDLTRGEMDAIYTSGKAKRAADTRSPPRERLDKAATPQVSKVDDRHEKKDAYDKRDRLDKYESERSYDKYAYNRYEKSPRKSRTRYEKKYDHDRFDNSGPVSCFYCLKVGHHLKRCWYLKADIENGTTHDLHKKFSCAVTIDRNQFMVDCLEAYIDEVNRERANYGASASTTAVSRSHGDYEVSECVGRKYHPKRSPTRGHQSAYAFKQSPTGKRSHSVYQMADVHVPSRLHRSKSVYGPAHTTEDFSPRKRSRAPSFEQQFQSYY